MIFSDTDYREAFIKAYNYGLAHAGLIDNKKLDAMFGDLNALREKSDGESVLTAELLKAVIVYLCKCYKEDSG